MSTKTRSSVPDTVPVIAESEEKAARGAWPERPDRVALVVVDVQNYFVSHPEFEHLPNRIADFIESSNFAHVLFTQFINHPASAHWRFLQWQKCTSPPDTDLHPALMRFARPENTFRKDSYSIFKAKGVPEYFQRHRIADVFLCGTDIDSCVLASAFDAFDAGYRVFIPDGLSLSHSGFTECALKIIKRNFVAPLFQA